jgi:hypothetical protein
MVHPILDDGEGVAADWDEIGREALRELAAILIVGTYSTFTDCLRLL